MGTKHPYVGEIAKQPILQSQKINFAKIGIFAKDKNVFAKIGYFWQRRKEVNNMDKMKMTLIAAGVLIVLVGCIAGGVFD